MERATGIEPAFSAWEADVLPLNYARGQMPRLAVGISGAELFVPGFVVDENHGMSYAMAPPRDPTNVMGRRITAFIIDLVISAAVTVVVLAATKDHTFTGAPSNACQQLRDAGVSRSCLQLGSTVYTWRNGRVAIAIAVGFFTSFLNNVVLQTVTGASLGKMILGLRVVDSQGRVAGFGRQLGRWLLLIVDSFFCYLVGLITSLATHPHRRVGDMAAGTFVIGHADVGQPVVPAVPMYAGSYQAAGGWVPPGTAPQPQAWGAPPPQPQGWGAPPPQPQGWGAPAPTEQQAGWASPTPPPAWGAPPPPPPPPPPASWGLPPPAATPTPPPPEPPPPVEPPPPAPPDTPPPPPQSPAQPSADEDERQ